MKKSRIILIMAVAALVLLSASSAFAATYGGDFWNGYTTTSSVYISTNGYIRMENNIARYKVGNYWYDNAFFKTTALRNGAPFSSVQQTTTGTTRTFDWTGDRGTGKLQFSNDYSPYTNYQLRNGGDFY